MGRVLSNELRSELPTDARIDLHPRQPNSKSFKSLTHPYLLVLNVHYRLLKTQVSRKDNNSFRYFLWLKAPIFLATSLPCCWKKCNKCKHEGHFPPVYKQLKGHRLQPWNMRPRLITNSTHILYLLRWVSESCTRKKTRKRGTDQRRCWCRSYSHPL